MTPKVRKEGFWLWKKTIVEHDGGTSVFSGNARVSENDGSLCVKEEGFINSESTCFLKESSDASPGSSLPNGKLVGRSKSIEVLTTTGESKSYQSGPLSLHSMEKRGDEVIIKKSGLFGDKIVERIPESKVSSIASEDCNVCKAFNPLYS